MENSNQKNAKVNLISEVGSFLVLKAPRTPIGSFDSEKFRQLFYQESVIHQKPVILDYTGFANLYSDALNVLRELSNENISPKLYGLILQDLHLKSVLQNAGLDQNLKSFSTYHDLEKEIVVQKEPPVSEEVNVPKNSSETSKIDQMKVGMPEPDLAQLPEIDLPVPQDEVKRTVEKIMTVAENLVVESTPSGQDVEDEIDFLFEMADLEEEGGEALMRNSEYEIESASRFMPKMVKSVLVLISLFALLLPFLWQFGLFP